MSAFTVELDTRPLERRLAQLPEKIERACLRKALRGAANKVKERLKSGTPMLTGFARRSVRVTVRVSQHQAFARVKYKGRPSFYMRVYELGSRRQWARPYLHGAVSGYEREAIADFMRGLEEAISGAAV